MMIHLSACLGQHGHRDRRTSYFDIVVYFKLLDVKWYSPILQVPKNVVAYETTSSE